VGIPNLTFQLKKTDGSEEKIDMVYSSLKYFGRKISDETDNKLEALLIEQNKLSDIYRELIKDQQNLIKVQQDQIEFLNERIIKLEELLFNVFNSLSASNDKNKI
jgi:hypothetical protein